MTPRSLAVALPVLVAACASSAPPAQATTGPGSPAWTARLLAEADPEVDPATIRVEPSREDAPLPEEFSWLVVVEDDGLWARNPSAWRTVVCLVQGSRDGIEFHEITHAGSVAILESGTLPRPVAERAWRSVVGILGATSTDPPTLEKRNMRFWPRFRAHAWLAWTHGSDSREAWLRGSFALDRYGGRWRFEAVQAMAAVTAIRTAVGSCPSAADGTGAVWREWLPVVLGPGGPATSRGSEGREGHIRDHVLARCVELFGLAAWPGEWERHVALLASFREREGFEGVGPEVPGWFDGGLVNETSWAIEGIRRRAEERGYAPSR